MGRVDDALRRAAELGRSGDDTSPAESGNDVEVLAHEPFPVEAPARRGLRSIAPFVPPPVEEPEVVRMSEGRVPHGSVFERINAKMAGKIVVDDKIAPASLEQYRRLAAALHHAQAETGVKVVMISSAVASEGKSLTASNLALTLSESYHRTVLLVDADLRRPSLHTIFDISGAPGLSEGLHSPGDGTLPVHQLSQTLTVLPAGQPTSDPMAGLTSARMRRFLDEAKREFDWVIIDTPPVGLLTDANLLASMVDAAILVVRAGDTPYDLVQRAVETIGRNRLLGVVLNAADVSSRRYGYDYYGSYHQPSLPAAK